MKTQTLVQADGLLEAMTSQEPAVVVEFAHYLADLARQENLTEIAAAADDVEHAAAIAGPKLLTRPLRRLSEAVVHAQENRDDHDELGSNTAPH